MFCISMEWDIVRSSVLQTRTTAVSARLLLGLVVSWGLLTMSASTTAPSRPPRSPRCTTAANDLQI
jgi:hypothetical protein